MSALSHPFPDHFSSLPAPAPPTASGLAAAVDLVRQATARLKGAPVKTGALLSAACAWAATSPLLGGATPGSELSADVREAWEQEMLADMEHHPGVHARRLWCHEMARALWSAQAFPSEREEATRALALLPDWRQEPWPLLDPKADLKEMVPHSIGSGTPGRLLYFTQALSQWLVYRLPALSLKDIIYTGPRSTWVTPNGTRLLIPDAIDESKFDKPQQQTLANDRAVLLALAGPRFREATEFWATMLYARTISQHKNPQPSLVEAITQQGALLLPLLSGLKERTWLSEDPGGLFIQAIPGFGQWQQKERCRWDLQDLQSVVADRAPSIADATPRIKSVRM